MHIGQESSVSAVVGVGGEVEAEGEFDLESKVCRCGERETRIISAVLSKEET